MTSKRGPQACSDPGEAPVPSSVPVAAVSSDLAGYDCLCVVAAQPWRDACPPSGGFTDSSPAAWCYAPSQPACSPKGGTAILGEHERKSVEPLAAARAAMPPRSSRRRPSSA